MKRITETILVGVLILAFSNGFAQELSCRVTVEAPLKQGQNASMVEKSIFINLQNDMSSFINDRRWTNITFLPHEKIECAIRLVITKSEAQDVYEGDIYVNLSRPIFNSATNSPLLSYQDQYVKFHYPPGQTFDYAEGAYLWTITSVLAYYANLFLGITFDSYSPSGGTPFFDKCLDIINSAPDEETGWSNQKKKKERGNRYELLEIYTNPTYSSMREILYQYHRLGLDVMAQNLEGGVNAVTESIDALSKLHSNHQSLIGILIFCMTKTEEFINIYTGQSLEIRKKIVAILNKLDPSNSNKYDNLTKL